MTDWTAYLESICRTYAQWWQVYTLTDVEGQVREPAKTANASIPLLDLGLMVETIEPIREEDKFKQEEGEAGQEEREAEQRRKKIERLDVLAGLRKYALKHVLLVGRPGSGKSTALVRLLLEEAERERSAEEQERRGAQDAIPVLVELRYYQTSVLDLIRDFLKRHGVLLKPEEIEERLVQGQLLLLIDGINELPSEAARRDLKTLRQNHPKTAMIFTTRDLGVGGDLEIQRKLEMQPLTEVQMQQFVRQYLPAQGEQMLRQLGNRLREFGQTPLLLWMLCSVFVERQGSIPTNLGSVFRQFTEIYVCRLQRDISAESRHWWKSMLRQLALVMTQGETPTEIQVAIPRSRAEAILMEFLQGKVPYAENCVGQWLEDLLRYHLIQLRADDQIEFRHQLIQEYYTAEALLEQLPRLCNVTLQRDYLNYLKWTEPLVLMLELVLDEEQAVRVVDLALYVDLQLAARLSGAVLPKLQSRTVLRVVEHKLPQKFRLYILELTRSTHAVPGLLDTLKVANRFVRERAAIALGNIGSERAIDGLLLALADKHEDVRQSAAVALGNIGSERAIDRLLLALADKHEDVRQSAAVALAQILHQFQQSRLGNGLRTISKPY